MSYTECQDCGDLLERVEVFAVGEQALCSACAPQCEGCQERFPEKEMRDVDDHGTYYCEDCLQDHDACPQCGGSGGGEGPMRCPYCHGSGQRGGRYKGRPWRL